METLVFWAKEWQHECYNAATKVVDQDSFFNQSFNIY